MHLHQQRRQDTETLELCRIGGRWLPTLGPALGLSADVAWGGTPSHCISTFI